MPLTITEEFKIRQLAFNMVFAKSENAMDASFHGSKLIPISDLPETIAFKAYVATLTEEN